MRRILIAAMLLGGALWPVSAQAQGENRPHCLHPPISGLTFFETPGQSFVTIEGDEGIPRGREGVAARVCAHPPF